MRWYIQNDRMRIGETNEWYGKGTYEAFSGKEMPELTAMLLQKYQFSIRGIIFSYWGKFRNDPILTHFPIQAGLR